MLPAGLALLACCIFNSICFTCTDSRQPAQSKLLDHLSCMLEEHRMPSSGPSAGLLLQAACQLFMGSGAGQNLKELRSLPGSSCPEACKAQSLYDA